LPWRNNLTALSQRFNLYIVAFHDVLHISRTGFGETYPENAAGDEWSMQLNLEPSSPGLPGNMPRTKPHAVNHLIVADLGNLEIVLVAHDDGDVEAFFTHDIETAMQESEASRRGKQGDSEDTSGIDDSQFSDSIGTSVRHFFQFNLGKSVWGLAVHSAERLIAVSTNGPHIWVFAFALSTHPLDVHLAKTLDASPDEDVPHGVSHPTSSQSSADASCSNSSQQTGQWNLVTARDRWLSDRSRNMYSELGGDRESRSFGRHVTNIPCITFDKEELSQNTRLISTDIGGCTVVWDLKEREFVTEIVAHHETLEHDPLRAGWGLVSLDPRSFRTTDTIISALGVCEIASRSDVYLVDISHSKQLIPHNKRWTLFEERGTHSSARSARQRSESPNANSDEESNEEGRTDVIKYTDDSALVLNEATSRALEAMKSNLVGDVRHTDYVNISASDCDDTWQFPLFFSEQTNHHYDKHDFHANPLNAPLLLLYPRSAHLFQSPDFFSNDRKDPIIYLSDPLEQHCRPDIALHLSHIDRLNLTAQIPELGVVLIGSGKGRVAILTLHKIADEHSFNLRVRSPEIVNSPQYTYTMRMLCILPSNEQEERNQRPLQPLVGLATAPIHGHSSDRTMDIIKRWRIMLTFRDHTVMSYEIAGRVADEVLHV
jgi:hypothetical protein